MRRGSRRGNVRPVTAPPMIRLAVLDLAGTTVRDDGAVEAAFVEALRQTGAGPDADGFPRRLEYLRTTMGRSKIEVFRELIYEPMAKASESCGLHCKRRSSYHL